MMSVIMHSIHKVRVKALKRVQRNIGSFEMNLWEPVEEEKPAEVAGSDRFSLGTSLSKSTLTELGSSLAHSDADTADTLSETLSAEEKSRRHFCHRYNWDLWVESIHFLWEKKYFHATADLTSTPSNLTDYIINNEGEVLYSQECQKCKMRPYIWKST